MNEQVLAVQRMQDYIQAHPDGRITMAELARASLFSPWHSYRLFKRYVGVTPAEYMRKLRLTESALRLKSTAVSVTDAALGAGYDSVEGYQRAFRREFGCNPGDYAKAPTPISLFVAYGVKFREMRRDVHDMDNVQSVFIQVIKKPARKVIIKRGISAKDYFPYCEEVGCDVWGLLTSMDSLCGEPVCLWLPERYIKPGTSTYVQGVEAALDYAGAIPEGFDVITLPEAEYLAFQGEPFLEENYAASIMSVQHAMDRYDPTVIGYVWDDLNPRIQLEPRGERGYIELRAVKKRNPS
ncbi:MAG: AraC family transcriptional regulator [Clostridia bacterium]|nr:AraC family transcriptional regulator [Clostridia bacterium]